MKRVPFFFAFFFSFP
ncbi:TPA: hypothetical protein MH027_05980 [Klebsiella variicola]|nr:hypothetical protein [Klebsiella variicola]